MPNNRVLLLISPSETGQLIHQTILSPAGYQVTTSADLIHASLLIKEIQPELVIISDELDKINVLRIAEPLTKHFPFTPFLLISEDRTPESLISALQAGFSGFILYPIQSADLLQTIQSALERQRDLEDYARILVNRDTKSLQKRITGLETIERIGRKVTSLLDLDSALSAIVDFALEISEAEESSLLLIDEENGELFIRASRNFQEDFTKKFRLPIRDSLAGQVLQTGKPLRIDSKTPRKIKTAYLVHSLIYMPIKLDKRVIGVLEVDNRQSGKPFSEYHMSLLAALADFAAIAIENAFSYAHCEAERCKLETILNGIEDGVIVVGYDGRLILINRKAGQYFNLTDEKLVASRLSDLIHHQDLLDVLRDEKLTSPTHLELKIESGRVLNTQITPIEGIGLVIVMQDITYLKELDQIKTDFVNTVSHDLRSPLTAILGYIELIDRVGPVNEQQREFIHRIQLSVYSITALINDLLDLGRIEAGFDTRKEIVEFSTIIYYSIEGLRNRVAEKSLHLKIDVPEALPEVLGNPIRLRQLVTNLLTNSIKYTNNGGNVQILARAEAGQIIFQVIDNGPGIPPADQPNIFDKFYRASNVLHETTGSGLGLAIVKSIVDNHQGRIWVDSVLGQGSTFTVVLPIADRKL